MCGAPVEQAGYVCVGSVAPRCCALPAALIAGPCLLPPTCPLSLQRILPEQQLLEDEQQCKAVLAYLPNDAGAPSACGLAAGTLPQPAHQLLCAFVAA